MSEYYGSHPFWANHMPTYQPKTTCIGCGQPVPVGKEYKIRVPLQEKFRISVDRRQKTPTGGRFGLEAPRNVSLARTETGPGCVGCSLRYPLK